MISGTIGGQDNGLNLQTIRIHDLYIPMISLDAQGHVGCTGFNPVMVVGRFLPNDTLLPTFQATSEVFAQVHLPLLRHASVVVTFRILTSSGMPGH